MNNLEIIKSKIIESSVDLRSIIDKTSTNKQIILVKGVYDLMHTGHLQSFTFAKDLGDILIVGVNSDQAVSARKGIHRPIIDQSSRMLIVAGIMCVNWVTLYQETSPFNLIRTLKPNVFVASHFGSMNPDEISRLEDVKLVLSPKSGGWSTTKIESKIESFIHGKNQYSS